MRSLLLLAGCLAGCGAAPAPCPSSPTPAPPTAITAPPAPAPPAPPDADVALTLRPSMTPDAHVHVELALSRGDFPRERWHLARGAADRIARARARDATGDIAVDVKAAAPGVALSLARAPSGPVTLAYDVLAGDDAPDDPLGLLVLDDRFRGAGEKLVALPEALPGGRANLLVRIDGEDLKASGAASSLGVGASRRASLPARALEVATFLAGSLGVQVIDDPAAGHDEGAWLGYTAFDPRPAVAELAQMRSGLRELLKSRSDAPWTYLLMSQTRPIGSFSTAPRVQSVLLQVGPAEPWSAALQLSMAQQIARQWIGGELRIATEPGHEAEGAWFSEGVSRYVALLALSRLGLLSPDDARDAVGGELSVLATSPVRALGNAKLSDLARTDPGARATLMARGALYALREAATIRARTKGEHGLDAALVDLVRQAEEERRSVIPVSAWLEAVGKSDPDASRTFEAVVTRGERLSLPPDALGPCFRATEGEYVAFDPGFDVDATRASPDGHVVGVRAGGPAQKAGLVEGDALESMKSHEGHPDAPVELMVVRAGARVTLHYVPRGAHGRGQLWSRVGRAADEHCGTLP